MSSAIHDYLNERKEKWLEGKIKGEVNEQKKYALSEEAEHKYSLKVWLPDAAKRAKQLSMSTHPCKFSHPDAKTSVIIACAMKSNDGYVRTGNISCDIDVFGNAAAMDVYKFLCLKLDDGRSVLDHLEENSSDIQKIIETEMLDYEKIKESLLLVKQNDLSQITDGLVKQIYFPVNQGYHLLSVLAASGILDKLKKQINDMRFSESAKKSRECHKKKCYSEGYDDLYGLTVTAYGGTKPQNISVLNSKNGGKFYLLPSVPPIIKKRNMRLPVQDFFKNTLKISMFKESFHSLHYLMKTDYKNSNITYSINNILKYIIDRVLACACQVRAFEKKWSDAKHYQALPIEQRIWLDDAYIETRERDKEWVQSISESFTRWIVQSYEKTLKKERILLGSAETQVIFQMVKENIMLNKEFFK